MDLDHVRAFHRAEPFRPFTLRLADGRRLRVTRREHMGVNSRYRELIVFTGPDLSHTVSIDDVVDVTTRRASAKTRRRTGQPDSRVGRASTRPRSRGGKRS